MRFVNIPILFILLFSGCEKQAISLNVGDVCTQPSATLVETTGFVSLPTQPSVIQVRKSDTVVAIGHQLRVSTNTDGTGNAVLATFWETRSAEPNKIKPMALGDKSGEVIVILNDRKEVSTGEILKVTGKTSRDEETGCTIAVQKIERP